MNEVLRVRSLFLLVILDTDGGSERIVLLDIKLELKSDLIQVLPSGRDVHYYSRYPGGDHRWVRRGGRSTIVIDDDIHQIIILKNIKTVRVDDRFLPCLLSSSYGKNFPPTHNNLAPREVSRWKKFLHTIVLLVLVPMYVKPTCRELTETTRHCWGLKWATCDVGLATCCRHVSRHDIVAPKLPAPTSDIPN